MERFGTLGNLPVKMDQLQRWSSLTGCSSAIQNYPSICKTNLSNRKWTLRSGSKLWALYIQPKLPAGIFGNLQQRKGQHFHLFSKKFSRNFPFHLTLLPEFQEFSVEWFVLRKIQKFPEFLETIPVNFWTICRCFQIMESFGWMTSAPWLNITMLFHLWMVGLAQWKAPRQLRHWQIPWCCHKINLVRSLLKLHTLLAVSIL